MMWSELFGMGRQELSDLAGTGSFVVWLFAQSPQLYENYRNSSCEGLSIVFLAQWMAGDVTNLVGCLLTKQLPFQIAVATYFCGIDLCILVQYFHYWNRDRLLDRQHRAHRRRIYRQYSSTAAPNMRSSSRNASLLRGVDRSSSASPSASIYRGTSHMENKIRPDLRYYHSHNDSSTSYKALSETARSVADLAKEFARRAAVRDASRQKRWRRRRANDLEHDAKGKGVDKNSRLSSGEDEEGDEGEIPVRMMNSTLSDSSRSSEEFGYGFGTASTTLDKKVWLKEKNLSLLSPTSDLRGRDMTRTANKITTPHSSNSPEQEAEIDDQKADTTIPDSFAGYTARPAHSRSSTRTTRSSRSSRSLAASRGAGIVLLGFTALIGLQSHTEGGSRMVDKESIMRGKASVVPQWHEMTSTQADTSQNRPSTEVFFAPGSYPHRKDTLRHGPPPPPPTWERVIGRISAWICTVLYMTSRLPQIWTNLSRQSVQGLSILLFISAALGNALYSVSVLINPMASGPARTAYLQESLPFLLGSGGTLIFDVIIVLQWMAWRHNAPLIEVPQHNSTISKPFLYRGSSRTGGSHDTSHQRGWSSLERQSLLE